jgi:hypothetical protein
MLVLVEKWKELLMMVLKNRDEFILNFFNDNGILVNNNICLFDF